MLLEAHGLTVERRGDTGLVRVLDGVDLAIDSGELVDVVGPSGAGKTTLLLALARLLPGAGGSLSLDGMPSSDIAPHDWRCRVALLPQRPALADATIAENLRLPFLLKARATQAPPSDAELRAALEDVGVEADLSRHVSRLSVGQAARVALLRTLLTRPEVVLLDEPDASLDDDSAASVTEATRAFTAEGGAAVRVRHLRSDALADRRYRLENGRLIEVAS